MANAERAYGMLTMAPLPPRAIHLPARAIQEAVEDVDWIQESVPERLPLKRGRHQTRSMRAARPDALIGSSTSGLLPSDLQAEMKHPERMFVAHPYNPVYSAAAGGARRAQEDVRRKRSGAEEAVAEIGMKGVSSPRR